MCVRGEPPPALRSGINNAGTMPAPRSTQPPSRRRRARWGSRSGESAVMTVKRSNSRDALTRAGALSTCCVLHKEKTEVGSFSETHTSVPPRG